MKRESKIRKLQTSALAAHCNIFYPATVPAAHGRMTDRMFYIEIIDLDFIIH